jgi:hypothetical protein
MPLKLTVGLSKKVGLPNYGSLGATCGLEVEVPSSSLHSDPEALERQVRAAFAACARAVQDELNRHRPPPAVPSSDGHRDPDGPDDVADRREGVDGPRQRPATGAQVRALRVICARRDLDLEGLVGERFDVDGPEGLSVAEASRLIDELQAPAEVPA